MLKYFNILKLLLGEFIVLYEYFNVLHNLITLFYGTIVIQFVLCVCVCLFHRSAHTVSSCGDFNRSSNRFGSKCDYKL